jgi:hypothetical protein
MTTVNSPSRASSDLKKAPSRHQQSTAKKKNPVHSDGTNYYTYIEPHKLVLNVDVHVRMLLEQEAENSDRINDKFSTLEPFKVPLPIPPKSKFFNRLQK